MTARTTQADIARAHNFRGRGITISAADQMAFYEIAQPIMRALATFRPCPGCDGHECDWAAGVCAYPALTAAEHPSK